MKESDVLPLVERFVVAVERIATVLEEREKNESSSIDSAIETIQNLAKQIGFPLSTDDATLLRIVPDDSVPDESKQDPE